MLRGLAVAIVTVALGLARDPGCDRVDDPNGGPNAPCTRDGDCRRGLKCTGGVCEGPDEIADAGAD